MEDNTSAKTLVFISGPPAVGKMTVGLELRALTGIPLFHNHVSLEAVLPVFPSGTDPFNRLVSGFRDQVFREVAESGLPGLIFTYMWAFDQPEDLRFRNETELRLTAKPSKRDVEASQARLLAAEQRYQLTCEGNFPFPDHLKIDNSELSPEIVAERIADHFLIPRVTEPTHPVRSPWTRSAAFEPLPRTPRPRRDARHFLDTPYQLGPQQPARPRSCETVRDRRS